MSKTVVVYDGGGALLPVHIGYTKGPLAPIMASVDEVGGISAGNLFANFYAHIGMDNVEKLMGTIDNTEQIFHHKDAIESAGDLIARQSASIPMGYSYLPLLKLVKKYIVGNPSVIVVTSFLDLTTGHFVTVKKFPDGTFYSDDPLCPCNNNDDWTDYVVASCITSPVVDGFLKKMPDGKVHTLVDGGFCAAGPVVQAMRDGATTVYVCLTGPYSKDCGFGDDIGANDPISTATRLLIAGAHHNVISSLDTALLDTSLQTYVLESLPVGSSTVFDQKDIQQNILIGQAAVAKPGQSYAVID